MSGTGGTFDLTGHVAVVTGGGRGLGRAIAAGLARHGAKLVLCGRNEETVRGAADALGQDGTDVLAVDADVSRQEDVLRLRELEFVTAAHALGVGRWRVALRHVLPNAVGPLFSLMVLLMGTVPIAVGTLSFLGLGPPPGSADWGQLVSLAQGWIQGPPGNPFAYWYVTLFPGLCTVLYSLGWNLLGDALSDDLDPRNR